MTSGGIGELPQALYKRNLLSPFHGAPRALFCWQSHLYTAISPSLFQLSMPLTGKLNQFHIFTEPSIHHGRHIDLFFISKLLKEFRNIWLKIDWNVKLRIRMIKLSAFCM